MPNLKINRNLKGCALSYHELLNLSIDQMERVLMSPEFKQALYDVIAKSHELEGELSIWKHKTVLEIFENLFEKATNGNFEMTLTLHTYYTAKKVYGYGYATDANIYLNTKYLGSYNADDLEDLKKVGSNLTHEHGHDCGYDHDFAATSRRKNSICYLLNDAYEIAFDQIHNINQGEGPEETNPEIVYYVPWYKKLFKWFR